MITLSGGKNTHAGGGTAGLGEFLPATLDPHPQGLRRKDPSGTRLYVT